MELTAQKIDDMIRALKDRSTQVIINFPDDGNSCALAAAYLERVKCGLSSNRGD